MRAILQQPKHAGMSVPVEANNAAKRLMAPDITYLNCYMVD
jgi:hypothetical protein